MRFRALACGYDGTIASNGVVGEPVLGAMLDLRRRGYRLLLVTGRRLDDLLRVFPGLTAFDAVVAENGAVLYFPTSGVTRLLARPPRAGFVEALRARGVDPIDVGKVVVATSARNATTVEGVIRGLGLPLHVVLNRRTAMVLPDGVDKAAGLAVALGELAVDSREVVGVGDGENDLALVGACGYAVAVANAVPVLEQAADRVTTGSEGEGVLELIEALWGGQLSLADATS